jgi:hypothetical protein
VSYYADLSPYTFLDSPARPRKRLNVGWLDSNHPYPTGVTTDAFRNNLVKRLEQVENRTRGYHYCDLCGAKEPLRITSGSQEFVLGSAEIHVKQGRRLYISPDLIVHYVLDHSYEPPNEYVSVVTASTRT